MNDYTTITHKKASLKTVDNSNSSKIKYLKNLVTRTLLSIILVISVSIITKINSDNAIIINDYLFQDSLQFTKINKWYQDKFGTLIPSTNENSDLVFSSSDLTTNPYENYLDGVKIKVAKGSPISLLNGGIIVFIGDKEEYGKTVIIQGNDGIDYWYGGLTNISINLYDYIEKDTLIGESLEDYIYLVLEKDSSYVNYEEYLKNI